MAQHMVRCGNCGTSWYVDAAPTTNGDTTQPSAVCPVCHLAVTPTRRATDKSPMARVKSVTDLEHQLDLLISSARASGLANDAIVRVLRNELAFAAEVGQAGRRFTVQLIDLGPQDGELMRRPLRDRRDAVPNRSNA